MEREFLNEAIELIEKANAGLEPELLASEDARSLLSLYARAERLISFGKTSLARKVDNAAELARITGTSIKKAEETVATGKVLRSSDDLSEAFKHGDVSLDQATEIARAEASSPGSTSELLRVAKEEPFRALREQARKVALEAEQHRGLATRQREARSARSYSDPLGMTHIHLTLEPHVATPIVARAEAEAQRLARAAKKAGILEPFERHAADAYAKALSGGAVKGPSRRPELVVLVSHEVAKRGWKDVKESEVCKIPGVGPVSPQVARKIADDAFLNAVVYDGKDLRQFARWTKHIPVEIQIALELGDPPGFDGVTCTDCGNRFRTEFDHLEPRAAKGPTSKPNLKPRCWPCHVAKTERDRKAGKLKPPDP
jgi:5-methylcytosine-specific restriction endonuclease McrA